MTQPVSPKEPPPSSAKAKKKGMKALIALGIIVLIVIVVFIYRHEGKYVGTNDALINGYIVEISSDLLLRITKLHVDEGYAVEQGQLVCSLDQSILLSQKAKAEANIVAMKASLQLKEHELQKIKDDYERALHGFEDQIISSQDFDHALKDLEIALSSVAVAKADIDEAVRALGVIDATLLHTEVRAPSKGWIVKRWVQTGDVVQAGQTIFSLVNPDNIWVEANLQETAIKNVRLGDPVQISIDAYPGVNFSGNVYVIKGASAGMFSLIPPDNATGNYTKVAQRIPLKITIQPPKNNQSHPNFYLFPGMSAEVKIQVE